MSSEAAMHRACEKFTLRAGFRAEKLRFLRAAAASVIAIALCAGLSACAEDTRYPSLSKIDDVGTVLTPEERQKAVEDLKKQEKAHAAAADKTASN
jgi:hypothetical protein